jgi:hypothetical protein
MCLEEARLRRQVHEKYYKTAAYNYWSYFNDLRGYRNFYSGTSHNAFPAFGCILFYSQFRKVI